jgi:UbiD family decarboxylase
MPKVRQVENARNHHEESRPYCLPVITTQKDGGPFLTLPVIHTKDLHSELGMLAYRMQVFDRI